MLSELDQSQLHFDGDSLLLLNISLAIIMFGVALEIRIKDFKNLWNYPKPFFLGVVAQFLLLPFLTFVLVWWVSPIPSVALGMFMVAACPGGNISNFLTNFAGGNTALSVTLTAFATVSAIVLTPLNFAFWAGMYPPTAAILKEISLDYFQVFQTVALILGVPLALGILVGQRLPKASLALSAFLKPISIAIFATIVLVAFYSNYENFLKFIFLIFGWVLSHNLFALFSGFFLARVFRLSWADTKTLTIETGIQNSGLALLLIFTFFNGLGGMAIIAGWWGIWHIISGFAVAFTLKGVHKQIRVV
ncbi:bile acid:sodium symporter family protein [Pleomorphovibrio marinus]|uniref:bile acid:sodium symporter family protein n=1 Tax=Pleomorphovibrio marinus TaxID=2164132 RepID=UPI000E0BE513|nr:bile acid:sodium symporter family protein [Pleomorphovibrio marinus]